MLSVQSDIAKAMLKLRSITEAQQFNRSVRRALNTTAEQIQAEVRQNMPSRFTLRRDWVLKGIMVKYAANSSLTATIFSRDKFMGLQEAGGAKNPLRHYIAIPTKAVRRTPKDMIKKADRPAALGDKASIIDVKGNKYLALKKPRKGASKNQLRLMYLLVPRAQIKPRLGLSKDGEKIARAKFAENLQRALEDAVRSAG